MITCKTDSSTGALPQSRRNFLRAGTMTIISVGMCLCGETLAFGQDKEQPQERSKAQRKPEPELPTKFELTRSKFTPHLSEIFLLRLNGEEIHLQLVEVGDLKQPSVSKSALPRAGDAAFKAKLEEESFTLLFRSASENRLRQNSWRLEHDTLGRVELFLVPVGRPEGPYQFYEAVFNRLQR